VLPTGVAINGVVELREQLAAHSENFTRTVTERLMMYAINRQLEYFDMPQVRGIVRRAAKDNYKLSSLILGIVNSDTFRKQGPDRNQGPDTDFKPESKPAVAKTVAAR
jgi:cytochrome c-type biogenesis protein CcmE